MVYGAQRAVFPAEHPARAAVADDALHDVMPYGVAMLLALSEGDGDNQLLYAGLYNRKRAACGAATRRRNVLFRHMEEDA